MEALYSAQNLFQVLWEWNDILDTRLITFQPEEANQKKKRGRGKKSEAGSSGRGRKRVAVEEDDDSDEGAPSKKRKRGPKGAESVSDIQERCDKLLDILIAWKTT